MSDSGENDDLLERIQKRNERRHAHLMAEAKRAADAIGKEPFDLSKLEQLCDTSHHGRFDPEEVRRAEYEDIYYVEKPRFMTMEELAAFVALLRRWD